MKIRVEKVGNRVLLAADGPTPGLKGLIPGAYFRKDKLWSFPLEFETCLLLRERFGVSLAIGPELRSWAKAEKAHRTGMKERAGAPDADLKRLHEVAPKLAGAMGSRTYQRSGVRYVVDAIGRDGRKRALLADTVGLGKTAQALGACLENDVPGPYLIVCPKTAVNATWSAEIRRWLPTDEVVTLPDGKAGRENILNSLVARANNWATDGLPREPTSLHRTWVIVHPYSIRTQTWWRCASCGSQTKFSTRPTPELDCGHSKDRTTKVWNESNFPQLFEISWGAVVIDESDQILIKKTGTPNLQRRGAELLGEAVRDGGLRLAMSGTPFRSKPHQIWSTLNWLDPVRWSGKWRWIEKYWGTNSGMFGGTTIAEFREERETMLSEELADVMLRRTRDMVRSDLPGKLYAGSPLVLGDETSPVGVWLPMQGKQLKAYKQMEQAGFALIDGGELNTIGVLAELTRLKQFAGAEGEIGPDGEFRPRAAGNKFDWLLEFLVATGFPDKPSTKVVVASQFTQLLNAFRAGVEKFVGLGQDRTGAVTGEISGSKREYFIECFEDAKDPLDLLFINTKAGGSSITLDAAEVMVILDETWVDDEQEQLEGRIDNRQPERRIVPRTYYYLRSLDSVEQGIAVNNAEAKRQGRRILDGATRPLVDAAFRRQ